MSLLAQDVLFEARTLLNQPYTSGRWSDAGLGEATGLLAEVAIAVNQVIRRIRWPESRLVASSISVGGVVQQEYAIPDTIQIQRVYLNGQIIVQTDIDTMEGRQTQIYDGGQANQGTPANGTGSAPGSTGSYSPAWATQTPMSYPLAQFDVPSGATSPWYIGERPKYYVRAPGVIGFVPAPLTVATICIDCILSMPRITSLTQPLNLPDYFLPALAWKVVERAKFSDETDSGANQANYAKTEFENEIKELIKVKNSFAGDQQRTPRVLTQRNFYILGGNRGRSGGF